VERLLPEDVTASTWSLSSCRRAPVAPSAGGHVDAGMERCPTACDARVTGNNETMHRVGRCQSATAVARIQAAVSRRRAGVRSLAACDVID